MPLACAPTSCSGSLYGILVTPTVRGGVTGFGLVHLIWGAHDLGHLLFRRRRNASADV